MSVSGITLDVHADGSSLSRPDDKLLGAVYEFNNAVYTGLAGSGLNEECVASSVSMACPPVITPDTASDNGLVGPTVSFSQQYCNMNSYDQL